MSIRDNQNHQGIQVDSGLYFTAGYCIPERFISYSYQIKEILQSNAKTVLEIGPGPGVVTYFLREAGILVDTVDHDSNLKPDIIASVLDLPCEPKKYDAVLCCQVLEHLPWNNFLSAMQQLAKVAKNKIILSLPHKSRNYYIDILLPKIGRKKLSVNVPLNKPAKFDGEHYWEIGKGVSEKEVMDALQFTQWRIEKSYRIPEFLNHHFFVLSNISIPKGI